MKTCINAPDLIIKIATIPIYGKKKKKKKKKKKEQKQKKPSKYSSPESKSYHLETWDAELGTQALQSLYK